MAGKLPLILLPPSEGKAAGGSGRAWKRRSMAVDLDVQRRAAIGALDEAMHGSEAARGKLLGVKGRALAAATAANRAVAKAPTLPAIERYTGVLYDALDHASLSAAQRTRLDRSVLIFSGLWGVVAPDDPIPDYKLKMGATLPGLGKLSSWWREPLTARVAELAQGRLVWNLLPNEHDAAWDPPEDLDEQWTVRFLDRRPDGSLATVSHANKALKGAFVRELLANPQTTRGDLKRWKPASGYRYTASLDATRNGLTTLSFVRAS